MSAFTSSPRGWRSYQDPPSAELQQFPAACGAAAERLAKEESPESDGGVFSRAAEFIASVALDHLSHQTGQQNAQALGISSQELMKIEPVIFIQVGGVEVAAEN